MANTAEATTRVMTLLLGGIAAVSLPAGGIGIVNIMLVSVTERTREIGIRIAAGARMRHVQGQFLIESAAHGLAGGLGGILVGVAAAWLLSAVFGWPRLIFAAGGGLPGTVPDGVGGALRPCRLQQEERGSLPAGAC